MIKGKFHRTRVEVRKHKKRVIVQFIPVNTPEARLARRVDFKPWWRGL